ncbi:endolytic transglycosylase MltG [Trichlorobacter ammonificans]|uniref:Endolytic murein transglycosylase n=1 Tax=Trichlorobacter ammonificans TaxID=2916410 RepID=A0ABN8HJT0_9BACT|nr:endolytic transglycosylase MltG [Trichlorobacter ammonificans]CAH2031580.1 Endolytic murein transglycosylase [Trichlorobacter ammonificans]
MLVRTSGPLTLLRRFWHWPVRIAAAAFLLWYLFLLIMPAGNGQRVYGLTVPKGAGLGSVAEELAQQKIVRSALHLRLVARLRGLDRAMQVGDYRLTDAMTPTQILEKMARGETDARRFTLPEGYSMFQAAELLERAGIFKKDSFLVACRDTTLLSSLAIPAPSAEGYLFPGTYLVGFHTDERALVTEMVREFRFRTASLLPLVDQSGFDLHQVVTLASMVEREAVSIEEMPLIASVFHNRLRIGMPLQSDPTAIYGIRTFGGTVTRSDVQRTSPYNTYRIKGLPPGPIGNPGLEAIRSVLHPAATDYYYFVARKDGTHQFSRTLQEHNQGVQRFLRKGKKRK